MRLLAGIGAVVILGACGGGDSGLPTVTPISPEGARHVGHSYSPDGSRIAYWAPGAGGWHLWVANADLSQPAELPVIGGTQPPLWSPDGSKLAVSSSDFGVAHAVVVPSSGGEVKRLTTGTGVDVPAGWYPDGDRVAYLASAAGGTFSGFVASLSTGATAPLIPGESRPHFGAPSPDGAHIAYFVIEGPKSTIWIADSVGANSRQITTEGFEQPQGSATMGWSPDSREILYSSRRTGTSDLWIAPIDGGPARQLTRDLRNDDGANWSPDGKWIAFRSDRGRQTDLWIVPAAGGEEQRVTDTPTAEENATWRPGINELTFVSATTVASVWAMDLADGSERRLTPDSIEVNWFNVSPDGTQINYTINRGGGVFDLAVMPLAGGASTVLVSGGGTVNAPKWSPDGSKIVFLSDRGGTEDVWVADVGGGAPRQLVNWPSYEFAAVWSGDGAAVYFTSDRDSKLGDVWRVAADGGEPVRVTNNGTIGGNLISRSGVSDLFAGTINPSGGQLTFSRVRPDGRVTAVWERTSAGPSAISPSGDSVVAQVEQPDGKMLDMMLPSGGGAGRVILGPDEHSTGIGSWSNDGKFLLYAVNVDGANDIGILTLADGTKRKLTTTPEAEGGSEFTPDAKTIVFRRSQTVQRLTVAKGVVR